MIVPRKRKYIRIRLTGDEWDVIKDFIADSPNWTPEQVAHLWFRTGLEEWADEYYQEGSE